jgi:predicted alpha/beta hydrolase family esterase
LLGEIKGLNANLSDQKVRAALHASAKSITLVGSDSDPWSPRGIQQTFGDPLGLQAVILEGAKHLALSDGFTYWQGVIDWVLDSQADLTVR